MLYCHSVTSEKVTSSKLPILVFLHGLLGCGKDWNACLPYLSQYPIITLDLAGHGNSSDIDAKSFEQIIMLVVESLTTCLPSDRPVVLIGYSMGARILMNAITSGAFSRLNLLGAILEGGHFGLLTDLDKEQRLKSDTHWANRFISEPIEQVLNDWYQQAVFSSLNHEQRQILVAKRSANLGVGIGKMLLATSLAKQENLKSKLSQSSTLLFYICGENDVKFTQIAKESGLSFEVIEKAGHNVHCEQPRAFAQCLDNTIQEWLKISDIQR